MRTVHVVLLGFFCQLFCLTAISAAVIDVAIVGAGTAGLTAAHYLAKGPFPPRVAVYEARGRTGGRIFTQHHHGPVDHGACYVDSGHSCIREILEEFKINLVPVKAVTPKPFMQFINGNRSFSNEDFERFEQPLVKIHEEGLALKGGDKSLEEELTNTSLDQYLDQKNAPTELKTLINLVIQSELGCSNIRNIQAKIVFSIIKIDVEQRRFELNGELGDEAFMIENGASSLIKSLAEPHDIVYRHRLTKVKKHDQYYELIFDAAGEEKRVLSKYVVLTLPLPLLKLVDIRIKAFPQYLRNFINKRTTGNNNKFFLFFDQAFWLTEERSFNLLTDHAWLWDNFDHRQENESYGLTAYFGGDSAQRASEQSDSEIIDELLTALTQFFPDARAHFKEGLRGHCWQDDEFSCGSYTGTFVVGEKPYLEALAAPNHGRLYFAGSSWSRDSDGFMNGAVETGKVAAQQIISSRKDNFKVHQR